MKADACFCPAAIWLLLCGGNLVAGCRAAALSHVAAHVVFCSNFAHAAAVETIPVFCTICLEAVLPVTPNDHLGLRIDMTKVRILDKGENFCNSTLGKIGRLPCGKRLALRGQ